MKLFAAFIVFLGVSLGVPPAGATVAPPPTGAVVAPTEASACYYGACYSYNIVSASTGEAGAQGRFTVERPALGETGYHSLAELSIGSIGGEHVIEVGWTVDHYVNNRSIEPHLFVYHWTEQGHTCYNTCGFQRILGAQAYPGMPLEAGSVVRFRMFHSGDRWVVSMNGEEFGFFPDSLWSTPWPSRLTTLAFGEVASTSRNGRVEMGNGIPGDLPGAARAKLISFGSQRGCARPRSSDDGYVVASTGRCAMAYGGP